MIRLSVVLTAYNRAALLREVLDSITLQNICIDDYELIVVNDGSTDDTPDVVEEYLSRLPLRYVYQQNAGLASAKNHGLAVARAPLVIFIDDDDILEPQTFRAHIMAHEANTAMEVSVLGFTKLREDIAKLPLMHFVTAVGSWFFSYRNMPEGRYMGYEWFWGGRTSSKRDFLLQSGGFNPIFRLGSEDIELGYRLSKRGLRVLFSPDAVSITIRNIDFDAFCNRMFRFGQSQYTFSRMWPEVEAHKWCEIPTYRDQWPELEPRYKEIIRRGRVLDKWANDCMDLGLEPNPITTEALHAAYDEAFRASRWAGIADAERKLETMVGTPKLVTTG